MAKFPFTGNLRREELDRFAPGREEDLNPYFAGGAQQQLNPYSQQYGRLGQAGFGAAAIAAGLYGTHRLGLKPLDHIYSAVRLAEDFSPAQVLRTFSVGDFLSQYTSANQANRFISPDQIGKLTGTAWFRDLTNRVGPDKAFESVVHGLTFRDGKLFSGETLLLRNARVLTSTGTPNLGGAYARSAGAWQYGKKAGEAGKVPSILQSVLGETGFLEGVTDTKQLGIPIEYRSAAGKLQEEVFTFTGAETKSRAAFNQGHALATEWIERANRLAESPFEMEPFATATGKLRSGFQKLTGTPLTLAVKSGAALPTLGRMAKNWGVLGTGLFLGYQTADWAVREAEILDNTPLAEGITAGVATVGIKASLLASNIADAIPGVRGYQEAQERIAPGSTSLTKLAALPAVGALGGLTGSYIVTLGDRAKIARQFMEADSTLSLPQALAKADPQVAERSKEFASETFDWLTRGKFKGRQLPFIGSIGRAKQFGFMGLAAGALLAAPFLPGALVPDNTTEELEDIYSGRQEVAVRKGRFWEFGRSAYEGSKIQYFRPHWYPRMLQQSYEKSLGIEERAPFKQWFLENFTYDMEREHYKDRPYPITGAAFEDIPIIGPLLGATLGQLVKPAKLMHTEEWLRSSEQNFNDTSTVLRLQERAGEGVRPDRGDTPPGTPVSAGSFTQVLGEQAYRLTELTGLVGFTMSSIKKAITGSDEWFDQEERLQSARRMYGAEREYWDASLGGGLGTTEFFRRLYPHRRRQIPEYNPIRNTMPEWLPGPGERGPDLLHGDPFASIREGELRLPGEGFAARFPELEGIDPEDYPDVYKYKILSDVAPYTTKTSQMERMVRAASNRGELTEAEQELFETAKEQMKEAKNSRKNFYEYQYLTGDSDITLPGAAGAQQSQTVLSVINDNLKARDKNPSALDTAIGGYWEGLIKAAQNPLEALTPLAPASKLMHLQSAIEDYERTQIYGPDVAFWDKPVENFILPFLRESSAFFGVDPGTPGGVQQQRQIQGYFDLLKYTKNKRLAEEAREEGLGRAANLYDKAAEETLTGVNPYSRNYRSIFRSLPRMERDYFNAFSSAKNVEDRERILELVPENERRLYEAQWEVLYSDELQNQMDEGLIPENLQASAQKELTRLYEKRDTEGFPVSPDLKNLYRDQRQQEESYGDWFRRTIIQEQAQEEGLLPGPDWVGWNPSVDLDDIKLKLVQREGLDIHDFDLWESDARAGAHREFLNEAVDELVEVETPADGRTESEIQQETEDILAELGISGQVHVYGLKSDGEDNTYRILLDVTELRQDDLQDIVKELNG